jgi:starch phosphorylase
MASLTPIYSANRSVRQYVEQCYLPAAAAYRARAENKGAMGETIACWRRVLDKQWATLKLNCVGMTPCGDGYGFTVEVALGSIDPKSLLIELYADARGDGEVFRQAMTRTAGDTGSEGRWNYVASVPATRPSGDYCARILPAFPGVSVPLENGRVLWER